MQVVSSSFRYSEQDYVRAMRAHYASRLRLPLDIVVCAAIAGLSLYELWAGWKLSGVALLFVSAAFSLMLLSAFTVIPKIAFRRELKFRDDYELTFCPKGIHFHTSHIESDLEWRLYTNALMSKDSYIPYYGANQF